jgi:hypothetical protein
VQLLDNAREYGEEIQAKLRKRLDRLRKPVELRRYYFYSDTIGATAASEVRSAEAFVGLRPNRLTR